MAVAALVLGIAGILIPFGGPVMSILAVVFGALGMKRQPDKRGMAVAGLVLGIIGVVWGVILIGIFSCVGCMAWGVGKEAIQAAEESGGFEALEELGETFSK
mgnify:CR=1 FL=1|jgi:hypothetical protein